MTEGQIRQLTGNGTFRGHKVAGTLVETHISWVILTRRSAIKIKKPLKLPFLDFSTLPLRKRLCEREVKLNRRFSTIYRGVLPIRRYHGRYVIDGDSGRIIDYAVHLRRIPQKWRMDNLLKKGGMPAKAVHTLAHNIATFHAKADKSFLPFNLEEARELFNNIREFGTAVKAEFGVTLGNVIEDSIRWSDAFLRSHKREFQHRVAQGFKRDLHGDLHCGNIFIVKGQPVIFDCIEFNDAFRKIDVLYEMAFVLMDLESYKQERMARSLLREYLKVFPCVTTASDFSLLRYFKVLRANVRAKVNLIAAGEASQQSSVQAHLADARRYLSLLRKYINKQHYGG